MNAKNVIKGSTEDTKQISTNASQQTSFLV